MRYPRGLRGDVTDERDRMRPDVLIAAQMPPAVVSALDAVFTAHKLWDVADKDGFFADAGKRVRGLAANTLAGRIDGALMDRLPALEIISSFGVGYDSIDPKAAAD